MFCVVKNNKKLIYNDNPQTWEFYDLDVDPGEEINLIDKNIKEKDDMMNKLIAIEKEQVI